MRRVVIGVGNPDRGDDGAGPAVARVLSARVPPGVTVTHAHGEPTSLMAAWADADAVFIIDACTSGAEPGTITRFVAHEAPLPEYFQALSTHGFGLGAAIEFARALDALPKSVVVYGVEAMSFEPCSALSPAVASAVETVAAAVLDDVTGPPA